MREVDETREVTQATKCSALLALANTVAFILGKMGSHRADIKKSKDEI